MNRILKHLAIYYNKNSTINNTINQNKSDTQYNETADSQQALRHITSANDVFYLLDKLQYNKAGIGLCGDIFTSKNGNKIIVEWHVRELTSESITEAYKQLTVLYENKIIKNMTDYDKLHHQLEKFINNNYFLGILLVFINGEYDSSQSSDIIYFDINTKYIKLENYGKNLIKLKKQQLIAND